MSRGTRFLHLPRLHFSSLMIINALLPRAERPLALNDVARTHRAARYGNRRMNYNFENFSNPYSGVHTPSASVIGVRVRECATFRSLWHIRTYKRFETNENLIKNFSKSFFLRFFVSPMLLSLSLLHTFTSLHSSISLHGENARIQQIFFFPFVSSFICSTNSPSYFISSFFFLRIFLLFRSRWQWLCSV